VERTVVVDTPVGLGEDVAALPGTTDQRLPRTLAGAFASSAAAIGAAASLIEAGFPEKDVSVVSREPLHDWREVREASGAIDEAGAGAMAGSLAGGAVGLAAGVLGVTLPGLGLVFVAGPLVGALLGVGAGAVAGGMVGLLGDAGLARDHADFYAESIGRGAVLVVVRVDEHRADHVAMLLKQYGALDLDQHVARWREAGDVATQSLPQTREEAERERRRYGTHADPLTGLPSTTDPEGDVLRVTTLRH